LYLTRQFLPWRRDGEGILIAAADTSAANLAWLRDTYGGAQIVSIAPRDLHREIAHRFRDRLSDDAVFSLWSKTPGLSARRTVTRSQAVMFVAVGMVVAVACCLWPLAVLEILVAAMSVGFAVSATFRTVLALLSGRNEENSAPRSAEGVLPIYTILVPLFREARVLPQLVRALSALDYPGIMQQAHLELP
jgi:hypothetical protein